MANILLKDWDWAGRYWVLDTAAGRARPSDSGVVHGQLHALPGHGGDAAVPRVAAVYAEDGRLWFQVDERRWEVGDVEFEHKFDAGGASQFTLVSHGKVVVDIIYLGPATDPVNMSDPSFDAVDMELQDIFYFMARYGRDPTWRANAVANWGEGVPGTY